MNMIADVDKIRKRKRAEIVASIVLFGSVLITLVSALTGNNEVVLYPAVGTLMPSETPALLGWGLVVLLIVANNFVLGWRGIGLTIICVLMSFTGIVFGSMSLSERIIVGGLFSNGKKHHYHDNFRIYRFGVSHGKGGPSYHVKVHPYGEWGEFKVDETTYRMVEKSTSRSREYVGLESYPFCVSVDVEQVGIAVRALSPPYKIDPARTVIKCPRGGVRSEDSRHTKI